MNPKISVIIPVYKVEPYLRQCLDSVVNQTYKNLEIILINDGSPDKCGEICDEYARRDPRITVIHKENGGLCAARNDGMERATGDWIAFVDSDDWCELDYYEQLVRGLGERSPDIMCAGGFIREFPEAGGRKHQFIGNFHYSERQRIEKLLCNVLVPCPWVGDGKTTCGVPWDKLYKHSFLKKMKIEFDVSSKAWEDGWFNFHAFDKAASVSGCSYIGYHYRQLGTANVRKYNPEKPGINYDFISKLYGYAQEQKLGRDVDLAIKAKTIEMIITALQCYYFHHFNQKNSKHVAQELATLKNLPYYRQAIWSNCNRYLNKKRMVFKYALRLPWVWPLRLLHYLNQKRREHLRIEV